MERSRVRKKERGRLLLHHGIFRALNIPFFIFYLTRFRVAFRNLENYGQRVSMPLVCSFDVSRHIPRTMLHLSRG